MKHSIIPVPAVLAALLGLLGSCLNNVQAWQSDNGNGTFKNPVLYADYPDPDIIRVSNDFYMVSTTFVDSPGINVLRSKDLVNWEIVSHCATSLDGGNAYNLIGGTAYRSGMWASSIRHYNGTFYVAVNPSFANGRIYYATNAAGPWQFYQLNQGIYDPGLFIDTDGTGYVVYGYGPQSIATLNSNYSQVVAVSNNVVDSGGEGSHLVKRGSYYYLFNANPGVWPFQLRCSRATSIFGPWETGRICLTATTGGHQGAIVDLDDSGTNWFGFVHQDSGAIGRMPRIGPVFWENDWPVFGTPSARDQMASSYPKPVLGQPVKQPATSDDFSAAALGLQWQWNHNPDNTRWSLAERPGFLRLRPTLATNFWFARNTLTQKGQGPWSRGQVKLDVSKLQPGDVCGFGTLGKTNGQIALTVDGSGNRTLNMRIIADINGSGSLFQTNVATAPFAGTNLYLRTEMDFQSSKGACYYSANGVNWTALGGQFNLAYDWATGTFQGEKFALFCYNTNTAASPGYVDVDSFAFTDTALRGRPRLNAARTTFVADNGQPLRGPYTSTEWSSAAPADQIANMRNLGFNAVHLYAEVFSLNWPSSGNAPGYNVAEVDKIVQRTRDAGLYLVMTIGNGANNGNHNLTWATNFWNFYAARYANETHVIYEIHNEPMAWGPSYLTGTTPAGTMDMEIAAYRAIRANAPDTPVLLFTYAVLSGSGGANAALTDIRAFNQAVFGNQNAVWTNEAVGFHGYGGWDGTASAVSSLLSAGYPCFMTEFGWNRWGTSSGTALEVELTTDLERLGVSWLTFQYIPPSGVSSDVTRPELFKNVVDNAGLSWTPDYGTWPLARGVFGNSGQPRPTVANWVNNVLTGTLRIQAEDFDWGGEGVACHDTTPANTGGQYRTDEAVDLATCNDTGGGYKVTSTADGEWLEYTILVRQPGYYDLALRYATPNSGGIVEARSALTDQTARRTLAPTGGFTTWATATVPVYLGYGRQKVRLHIPTGGFDLNWIELSPAASGLVANGTYKFLNAATALAMEGVTGTNRVVVTNSTGAAVQQWTVQHVGGQYRVVSAANGSSWNATDDVLGLVSSWNTSKERCYIIVPASGSFYRLVSVSSGLSLNGPAASGAIVQQQDPSSSANQQWAIVPPTSPAFPAGLSATALSATQVALQWLAVPGAASYSVKRSASSGGPYTTIAVGLTATNFTDTVSGQIKYYYVVTAISGGVESSNSMEASVNPPYPWLSQNIGSVGVAGSVNFSQGVFTVGGSGADIWGTTDAFRFTYLAVNGNCTITARVLSVPNTDGWAKAGVMIRASLAANAANAFVAVTPGNGVTWQYRTSSSGNTGNNATGGLNAPYWVRLVRSGNTFTAYRSPDGVTWTQQGSSQSISMNTAVYVGLAVTSHNNSSLCNATFDNVSLPGWQNVLPPLPPAALTASATNWQVNLAWPPSANATSYNIRRATTDGGPYTFIANVSTANYTDAALSNGVPHYYVVSALNIAGESANSVQAGAPAQYLAPTGLSATPTSSTAVLLRWNAFTNATSYNVKSSPTSGGPYGIVATGVTTTNFTATTPAGMKFYYVVSAVVSSVETQDSAEAAIGLPYPWVTQDVGAAGLAGAASINNGVFTLTGSGSDIWDTADAFRFTYVPVTGNCTITARVLSLQNTDPWAKAGVMIRETTNANSVNAFIAVTPGNGVTFQTRTTTGGTSGYNNTTGLVAPYWVRLVRSGTTFTAYRSTDGVNWTQQGNATAITMAATVYVGLVVTAHNNALLCTALFDNVSVPGWSSPMPPAAPSGLVATSANAQAVLTWATAGTATSYNVKRSTINGGPYSYITNVTTTSCTDPGLNNGTTYYYVVSALNQAGESTNTLPASVTPGVVAVAGLSATAVSASQIDLTWNALAGATSYTVKRSLTNGGSYAPVASGLTGTSHPDTGLAGGTIYYYVVSAVVSNEPTADSAPAVATTFSGSHGQLLHRYSFNESGGGVFADTVGGPIWNGTLPNGATLPGGQATLAPASSQYAALPTGIISTLTNFTIETWVRLNSTSNWTRLFDFGSGTTVNMFLTPQNGISGTVRFAITTGGGGGEQQINTPVTMGTGVWHHVAVTLNGNTGILYLNGAQVGITNNITLQPFSLGSTPNNYLGRSQYAADPYLNASFDEFRIYNAALSAAEIAATSALGSDQLLSTDNPVMSVTFTPSGVTLSWSLANAGFTVQSRTNLVAGDWENVTTPAPQIVGDQWQVVLPEPGLGGAVFYRLSK